MRVSGNCTRAGVLCMVQNINFVLNHKPQLVQHSRVFLAGGDEVDAGGFDGAVAQDVGELGDVPRGAVERPGE